MSVVVYPVFVKVVDFSGDYKDYGDYRSCAAKNAGHFSDWDQSFGDHGYELRSESEDDIEEKTLNMLSAYNLCLTHKIYQPDGFISGIDITEVQTNNHYMCQGAVSQSSRSELALNGIANAISNMVGKSIVCFKDENDFNIVVFYNSKSDIEELDEHESFEEAILEYPENNKLLEFSIGEKAYGNIVTMPLEMASRYFDSSDFNFD